MPDEIPSAPAPAPAPAAKPKLPKEQSLVLGILGARDRGKKQYGKAGDYLDELRKLVRPGQKITLADGRVFNVVDTFKEAESVKKMVFIDRFALEQVKG